MRGALILLAAACGGDEPAGDPTVTCGDGVREEFENCDDGNRISGDGCDDFCQPEPLVTVTWAFYPMLGGPPAAGCRAGVATIELVTQVDTTARFPCDDTRSGTIFVPPLKKVLARLRGPNDEILSETLPQPVPGTWRVDAPFYEDAGYIRASLPIASPCGSPITLTLVDGAGQMAIQQLPCSDSNGNVVVVSRPIRAGTYDIRFENTFDDVYARAGVVVGGDNRVSDLAF